MPTYSYKCTSEPCGTVIEDDASMSGYLDHHPACTECGSPCNYVWVAYPVHAILKDGPSGSWPSKGERFKKFRAKQSEAAAQRQQERFGHIRKDAVPNYEGKDTGTWQEAQIQAMKEKGPESAASFNEKVRTERAADPKVKV